MIDALMLLLSLGVFLLLLLVVSRSNDSHANLGLFAFRDAPKSERSGKKPKGKGAADA